MVGGTEEYQIRSDRGHESAPLVNTTRDTRHIFLTFGGDVDAKAHILDCLRGNRSNQLGLFVWDSHTWVCRPKNQGSSGLSILRMEMKMVYSLYISVAKIFAQNMCRNERERESNSGDGVHTVDIRNRVGIMGAAQRVCGWVPDEQS